jgi:AcrR family transcriptional regulator
MSSDPDVATAGPVEAAGEPGGTAGPQWRQRAIDLSALAARQRGRVQRFLNAAREIIAERGTTEFTVQEVVDRSQQSLRSFYQYFDGKQALLLALFEEQTEQMAERIRAAASGGEPLDRLKAAVILLYELSAPGRVSAQPLVSEFATRLVVNHPDEVAAAYAPVVDHLAGLVEAAAAAGLLRPGRPRRIAAIVLQSATVTAVRSGGGGHPITADELWEFCLHAIAPDSVAAAHSA